MALNPVELTGGLAIGTGLGGAISDTVTPRLQKFKNEQWQKYPHVPPSASSMAVGVAQGQVDPKQAAIWASQHGIDQTVFNAMVDVANVGPGSAYAFEMWRRGQIGEPGFRRALLRLGWEQEWIDDAVQIKNVLLSPEALAVMIQRTVVPNPGILPNQPDTAGSNVPPMPTVDLDVVAEAAGSGTTKERLSAMARIIGLPASPDLAARMHFRKIITEGAYNQAILEGNTRGEWAPFLLDGFRQIPTAEQFVEGHLRGWITQAEMYDGTALHGMSKADTDLEFQIHRRPLTPHQIKQALARGASFNPEPGEITNPYTAAVHQNNLGPEWYEMGVSLAGSYPSLFITNRLVTSAIITPAQGRTWMEKSGMADEVVAALHDSWTGGATATADPHLTKAQNQLWTTSHRSFVASEIDGPTATDAMEAAGVSAATSPAVLALWTHERSLVRKQLTPAQVKKAYKDGLYTRQRAVDALLARGYDQADADTLLDE